MWKVYILKRVGYDWVGISVAGSCFKSVFLIHSLTLNYFPEIVGSNRDIIAFGHLMDNECPFVEVILKNLI